jgi:hypothetical protein
MLPSELEIRLTALEQGLLKLAQAVDKLSPVVDQPFPVADVTTPAAITSAAGARAGDERQRLFPNGCPKCSVQDALRKSKFDEFWYCWSKLGGCGKRDILPVTNAQRAQTPIGGKIMSYEDKLALEQEISRAKIDAVSPRAWLDSRTLITLDHIKTFNLVNEAQGWAPMHEQPLPPWTLEEWSVKILNNLEEDADSHMLTPRIYKELRRVLIDLSEFHEPNRLIRFLLNETAGYESLHSILSMDYLEKFHRQFLPEYAKVPG